MGVLSDELMIDKARFFQNIQAWPLNDKLNYNGWLGNFSDLREKQIARALLNFFLYYNEALVDKLLMCSIGKVGYKLRSDDNWNHTYFRHACYYSTIPGDAESNQDNSGSGVAFLRKIKTRQFDVHEGQICGFMSLFPMLVQTMRPVTVIFVDDFVGSGDQCTKAFKYRDTKTHKTLNEIAAEGRHKLVFAPTIINEVGYKKIREECPNIILSCSHILGQEYNLFSPDCLCWNEDVPYEEGISFIINKSREIGIPEEGETGIKGYKEQGLALSFAHGTPDATIPLFYWSDNGWIPLVEKAYERVIY